METRFVLITSWNIKFYRILQAGDETRRREPGESDVEPSLVNRHCRFVSHATNIASVVPRQTLAVFDGDFIFDMQFCWAFAGRTDSLHGRI